MVKAIQVEVVKAIQAVEKATTHHPAQAATAQRAQSTIPLVQTARSTVVVTLMTTTQLIEAARITARSRLVARCHLPLARRRRETVRWTRDDGLLFVVSRN